MNKYTRMNWENTPSTATPLTADNLNHMDDGIEQATNGAIALETEIATARGGSNSLGARLDTADANLAKKANKSDIDSINSRLQTAEKALTGKANATDVANALKSKEDNLNKVSSKTDITDSNANYPSIEYLGEYYYDANESYSSEETDKLLATKYDSSNIETGKGELTPAQAIYDGFEGSFNYSKIGKTVTVALNITTLVAGKNYVQFVGLPFTAMTASRLSSIAVYTTANKLVNIRFDGSGLHISSPGTTFADGEKINAIITYIIN